MGATNQDDAKPPLFTLQQVSRALDDAMSSTLNRLAENHQTNDSPTLVTMQNIIDLTGPTPRITPRKRPAVTVHTSVPAKITPPRNHEDLPLHERLRAQNQSQRTMPGLNQCNQPQTVIVQTPAARVIAPPRNQVQPLQRTVVITQNHRQQNTMLAPNQYNQPTATIVQPPGARVITTMRNQVHQPQQQRVVLTQNHRQQNTMPASNQPRPVTVQTPAQNQLRLPQNAMLIQNQNNQPQNLVTTRNPYNPPAITAPAQGLVMRNVVATQSAFLSRNMARPNSLVPRNMAAQNQPRKMPGKKRSAVINRKTSVKNHRASPKMMTAVRNQVNQPAAMPPVQNQSTPNNINPVTAPAPRLIKMNHSNDELNEMGLPIPSTSSGVIHIFNSDSEDEMVVLNKTDDSDDLDDSDDDSVQGTEEDMNAALENLLKDPDPVEPMDAKSVTLRDEIETLRKKVASSQTLLEDLTILKDGGARLRATFEAEQARLVELEEEYYNHLSMMPDADNFGGLSISLASVQALHDILKSRPKEDDYAPNPRGLVTPLMRHQQHALLFLRWREQQNPAGGILADDMGLGKTLTMIALILWSSEHIANVPQDEDINSELYYDDDNDRPKTLVVCPASLLTQWESEIRRHTGKGCLRTKIFHGQNRPRTVRELKSYDVVITTYHLIAQRDKNDAVDPAYARDKRPCPLKEIHWRRIILDEAHIIRNHQTAFFKKIKELKADKRWALTGTPIQNKAEDMFSILSFLQCRPFDRIKVWRKLVRTHTDMAHQRIATLMNTIMLRRTKKELMEKGQIMPLPEKNFEIVSIKLNEEERSIYEEFLAWSQTMLQEYLHARAEKSGQLDTFLQNGGFNHTGRRLEINRAVLEDLSKRKELLKKQGMMYILVLILRLRQACCHPALIHGTVDSATVVDEVGADPDVDKKDVKKVLEDLSYEKYSKLGGLSAFEPLKPSSKLEAVLAKVREILDLGEKMIIVSQWTKYLNLIEQHLKNVENASWGKFTGAENIEKRQGVVEDFNNPQTAPMILLLSLTAGGVGLNLVGANHMLFVDVHWNPQLESQCSDRIYRFGQKKNCYIYKFLCSDSMEEKVKDLQEHKLKIANDILTPGADRTIASRLTLGDIKKLFGIS